MKEIIRKSESIPIFLAFLYLTVFNFIDTDFYCINHYIFEKVDNFLSFVCIMAFLSGGYKYWKLEGLRCFSVVITLNLLTEFAEILGLVNYYEYYLAVLYLFVLSFLITSITQKDDN